MATVLDNECLAAIMREPQSITPWWLMASFLYYHRGVSLLSDRTYDKLAQAMLMSWSDVSHPHKHLITKEDLEAGSLYNLKEEDYPNIVKSAACRLANAKFDLNLTFV